MFVRVFVRSFVRSSVRPSGPVLGPRLERNTVGSSIFGARKVIEKGPDERTSDERTSDERTDKHTAILGTPLHNRPFGQKSITLAQIFGDKLKTVPVKYKNITKRV